MYGIGTYIKQRFRMGWPDNIVTTHIFKKDSEKTLCGKVDVDVLSIITTKEIDKEISDSTMCKICKKIYERNKNGSTKSSY